MILKSIIFFLIAVLFTGCKKDGASEIEYANGEIFVERLAVSKDNEALVQTENFTKSRAEEALLFVKDHKMNEDFCFLIDMSIHSGKK